MRQLLPSAVFVIAVISGVCWCLDGDDSCHNANCDVDVKTQEFLAEQLIVAVENVLQLSGECVPIHDGQVNFLLFTRNNPTTPITLDATNLSALDPTKRTNLLAPGWISPPLSTGFPELLAAYLQRYDCNVIIVDWYQISFQKYDTVKCQIPLVAEKIAQFLLLVHQQRGVHPNQIHMVGHSFGGQLAGATGKAIKAISGMRLGRITGLDPAGPKYQDLPPSQRLDASDAVFVDIIHTNAAFSGYYKACGDADFYVNCGTNQPGCAKITPTSIMLSTITLIRAQDTAICQGTDFNEALQDFLNAVACSHYFSLFVMAESINSNHFVAKSCDKCPCQCKPDGWGAKFSLMGENCPGTTRGTYWIPTSGSPPYALGCAPNQVVCG